MARLERGRAGGCDSGFTRAGRSAAAALIACFVAGAAVQKVKKKHAPRNPRLGCITNKFEKKQSGKAFPNTGPCEFSFDDVKRGVIDFERFLRTSFSEWCKASGKKMEECIRVLDETRVDRPCARPDTQRVAVPLHRLPGLSRPVVRIAQEAHVTFTVCAFPRPPHLRYTDKPLLSSRHHATRREHALSLLSHLVAHHGPRLDGILAATNEAVMQGRHVLESDKTIGSTKRTPTFTYRQADEVAASEKARLCAEAKSSLMLSRANYLLLAPMMGCPGWEAQRDAGNEIIDGFADAFVETIGLRGERSGVVIDPSWWVWRLLQLEELVSGTLLSGRGAPRPAERVGLIFRPRPFEVLVTFDDSSVEHAAIFEEERPADAVARYLSHELNILQFAFLPFETFAPSRDALPRVGRTRIASDKGAAASGARTAIVTVPNGEHRTLLRASASRLGLHVSHGIIYNVENVKNCDAIGLWTGGTEGTAKLQAAGSLNHCQMRIPVDELFRSKDMTMPWMFNAGDDNVPEMLPHLNTRRTTAGVDPSWKGWWGWL
jgi:hypothetical protein